MMNPQIPDLAAKLREIADKNERLSAMKTFIESIPDEDARFRQTFQVFLKEAETDPEAMEITIDRLSGYWRNYHEKHPISF